MGISSYMWGYFGELIYAVGYTVIIVVSLYLIEKIVLGVWKRDDVGVKNDIQK